MFFSKLSLYKLLKLNLRSGEVERHKVRDKFIFLENFLWLETALKEYKTRFLKRKKKSRASLTSRCAMRRAVKRFTE